MQQNLSLKANINDMRKTMTEVANNLHESRNSL